MKKFIALLLILAFSTVFFGCGHKDGDLGAQTIVDEQNGYTIIQEVKPFKYKDEEDFLKKRENLRTDGFKVTAENTEYTKKLTKKNVVDIALEEVTAEFNAITAHYDNTRGIWKVVFSDMTESEADGMITRSFMPKEIVYIDEDGYTLCAYTE